MYSGGMKTNKNKPKRQKEHPVDYSTSGGAMELRDALLVPPPEPELLRTQVYLTREEHQFLQAEANRMDTSMASILRGIIDERMRVPEKGWSSNPLLAGPVEDSRFEGHEDGALNHDVYIYGKPPELARRK